MKRETLAVLCGAAVFVSGCAGQKDVELDQTKLTGVHRVAVVGPVDPVPVAVFTERQADAQKAMAAAAAIPFAGVLGAAIAGRHCGRNLGRDRARDVRTDGQEGGRRALHAGRGDAGLAGRVPEEQRLRRHGGFVHACEPVQNSRTITTASRTRPISCSMPWRRRRAAMWTRAKNTHFRPVVVMNVHLVRAADHTIVMHKQFVLDDATAKPDAYHIQGRNHVRSGRLRRAEADVGKCLDGVKAAVPVLTQDVATTLTHTPQTAAAQQ